LKKKKKNKQPNFLSDMNSCSKEEGIEAYDFMHLDSSRATNDHKKQAA